MRDDELRRMLGWMAADTRDACVQLHAVAGDVFEQQSAPWERNLVAEAVVSLADGAPVLIVRGNHDADRDLDLLGKLRAQHQIVVVDRPQVLRFRKHITPQIVDADDNVAAPGTDVLLCCLPWPRKAQLVANLGRVASIEEVQQLSQAALQSILEGFRQQVLAHKALGGRSVLVAHAQTVAAYTTAGQPLVGCDMEITPQALADVGCDYVALAHVHMRQEVAPRVWYSGGLRRTDFGDGQRPGKRADAKGYNLVRLGDSVIPIEHADTTTVRGDVLVQHRISPCAPMLLLEAAWRSGDDGAGLVPAVRRKDVIEYLDGPDVAPVIEAGSEVRYRYHAPADQRAGADAQAAQVRAQLLAEGAARVVLEPRTIAVVRPRLIDVTPADVHHADAVAASSATEAHQPVASNPLWRKVVAYLRSTSQLPDDARLARLHVMLLEIASAAGVRTERAVAGGLRIDGLRLKGFGPYVEETELALDRLPGSMVAITGENGAGKSFLIGAIPSAAYLRHPDRAKDLVHLAQGRDAFLELRVRTSAAYRLLVNLDAVKEKKTCYVFDGDGKPASTEITGGVRPFERWVADNLPAEDMFLASAFSAQKRRKDPVEALPGQRHDLLVELLDLRGLQQMQAVVDRAVYESPKGQEPRGLQVTHTHLLAQWDAAHREAEKLPDAQQRVLEAEVQLQQARQRVLEADEALRIATDSLQQWQLREQQLQADVSNGVERHSATARDLPALEQTVQRQQQAVQRAVDRQRQAQQLVERSSEVQQAQAQVPAAEQRLAAARNAHHTAAQETQQAHLALQATQRAQQEHAQVVQTARQVLEQARQAEEAAQRRLSQAEKAVAELPQAEQAERDLLEIDPRLAAGRQALDQQQDLSQRSAAYDHKRSLQRQELETQHHLAGTEVTQAERKAQLRTTVPCNGAAPFDTCGFLRDVPAEHVIVRLRDTAKARAEALQRVIDAALPDGYVPADKRDTVVAEYRQAVAEIEEERRAVAPLAARVVDLRRLAGAVDDCRKQLAEAQQAHLSAQAAPALAVNADAQLRAEALQQQAAHNDKSQRQQLAAAEVNAAQVALDSLRATAASAQAVADAERSLQQLAADETQARADEQVAADKAEQARKAIAAIAEEVRGMQQALQEHKRQRPQDPPKQAAQDARAVVEAAQRTVGSAEGLRDSAKSAQARAAALRLQLADAETKLADAQLLLHVLGRTGLQAAEIDSARPEISSLVNELLAEGWGDRWYMELLTQLPKADGSGEVKNGLWFWLRDNDTGKEGDAGDMPSGGEQDVITEAVRLAISVRNARAAGVAGGTLVRDESTRGLSVANAVRWVRMMRRAAYLGSFGKVVFVSHHSEAQAQADVRVLTAGGRLTVQ